MKTIILTETQVKNVIDRFISEQTSAPQPTKPIKQFNITNSFGSGKFQLTTTKEIDTAINEINGIVSKTPNVKYEVVVTSSESKVPNRGVGLKPGELSLKRGQAAELYIKEKLGDKVDFKITNLGAQGPEWNPTSGSDNPQYTKFQYVTISLVVSGSGVQASDDSICAFKFTPEKGTQGLKENNYVTLNRVLKGKAQLSISTGTIPDRMMILNVQGQIVKDTGYIATEPHQYTRFKYVPMYVAGLTRLLNTPAVSGNKIITFKANTFEDVMKNILNDPGKIPTQQEMITDGREVSEGVTLLKQMFNSGTRTFAIYQIVSGVSTLEFDTNIKDNSVTVISPLGQTGYTVTGRC